MSAFVEEQYTWTPTVKIGETNRENARVRVWDNDGDSAVNELTDADGQIPEQRLFQAIHTIDGTATVTTNVETPQKVRTLYIGNTDLDPPNKRYATVVDEFSKDLGRSASLNTIFLDIDLFVNNPKSTISDYNGISFDHTAEIIYVDSTSYSVQQLYEAAVNENYDNPQFTPTSFIATRDGSIYDVFYDIVVTSATIIGNGKTLRFNSGKDITFVGAATFSGTLTIDGDVNWGTETSVSNLTVTGAFDFSAAGTYNFSDCTINEVTNSSGGSVTINATDTTISINTGPNITIVSSLDWYFQIVNEQGDIVNTAEFRIYSASNIQLFGVETSDGTEKYTFDALIAGTPARVVTHDLAYLHNTQNLVHPSTSNSAASPTVITLSIDRVYENPT